MIEQFVLIQCAGVVERVEEIETGRGGVFDSAEQVAAVGEDSMVDALDFESEGVHSGRISKGCAGKGLRRSCV